MNVTNLTDFLSNPAKSRSREYILTTRLIHDLTVAAAARGYDLRVYLPTIDADGFDIILDDGDRLLAIQLKAVTQQGRASNWSIHRALIRPKAEDAGLYGFQSSQCGVGRGGGVILTKVAASGELAVDATYAYTDIDVLSAIWLDLVPLPAPQRDCVKRLRSQLESEIGGKLKLPRSSFLRASTPEHLLALCGLHSRIEKPWRLQLRKLLALRHLGAQSTRPEETLRINIKKYLRELSERAPEL
jgi:hypothetical protein